jgi:integration host factor subunit beta
MNDALVAGHRIEIRGFGSFSINRRPPRMGRNPRSGESVAIPKSGCPTSSPARPCVKPSTSRPSTAEIEAGGGKGRKPKN